MGVRAKSIYGIFEFSFDYKASKVWKVTCRVSAVDKKPLRILEASSEDTTMEQDQWFKFLGDMNLLEDFRNETIARTSYFFTVLKRPPIRA